MIIIKQLNLSLYYKIPYAVKQIVESCNTRQRLQVLQLYFQLKSTSRNSVAILHKMAEK